MQSGWYYSKSMLGNDLFVAATAGDEHAVAAWLDEGGGVARAVQSART